MNLQPKNKPMWATGFAVMAMLGSVSAMRGHDGKRLLIVFDLACIAVGFAGFCLVGGFKVMNRSSILKCGKCAEPMPLNRLPKNRKQMLWGGWTCPKCGTELDRSGRPTPE